MSIFALTFWSILNKNTYLINYQFVQTWSNFRLGFVVTAGEVQVR